MLFLVALNVCAAAYPPPVGRLCEGFCGGLAAALCSVMAFFYSFINFFSFYRRNPIGSFFCENLIR
jgi:hypothetical protein